MAKLTTATRKSADFKELQKLKKELKHSTKLDSATLAQKNDRYTYLQTEVVRSDTELRKERAEAKVLSKTTLPKTFVPFDPKGSGYSDSLKSLVSDALNSIAGGVTTYAPVGTTGDGSGTMIPDGSSFNDNPTQSFFGGLGDKVNQFIGDQNSAISDGLNQVADNAEADTGRQRKILLVAVAGLGVVFYLKKRKRK
jgi:hypothetical protein